MYLLNENKVNLRSPSSRPSNEFSRETVEKSSFFGKSHEISRKKQEKAKNWQEKANGKREKSYLEPKKGELAAKKGKLAHKSKKLAGISAKKGISSAKKRHLGTKKGYLGAKQRPERAEGPKKGPSQGLSIQKRTIGVLLDSGSSGDLLFLKKGARESMATVRRAVPHSWGTSNGTFLTKRVADIEISFIDYSASKRIRLRPDIVEYEVEEDKPMFDLILGKATLHELGVVLDFKEKTIQIDEILLPMRNIANLQLKPCITRALNHYALQAKEPVST
jgi:hypothetical protein